MSVAAICEAAIHSVTTPPGTCCSLAAVSAMDGSEKAPTPISVAGAGACQGLALARVTFHRGWLIGT